MEQIVIEANYFNLLPSGGWMSDFKGTFFIDSSGKVSLNHEVLTQLESPRTVIVIELSHAVSHTLITTAVNNKLDVRSAFRFRETTSKIPSFKILQFS